MTGIENLRGFNSGVTMTSAQLDGLTGYVSATASVTLSDAGALDLRDLNLGYITLNLSAAGNTVQLLSAACTDTVLPAAASDVALELLQAPRSRAADNAAAVPAAARPRVAVRG